MAASHDNLPDEGMIMIVKKQGYFTCCNQIYGVKIFKRFFGVLEYNSRNELLVGRAPSGAHRLKQFNLPEVSKFSQSGVNLSPLKRPSIYQNSRHGFDLDLDYGFQRLPAELVVSVCHMVPCSLPVDQNHKVQYTLIIQREIITGPPPPPPPH